MTRPAPHKPDFLASHAELLEQAVAAIEGRGYWSPFAESPSTSVYGENAPGAGEEAFRTQLGQVFELPGHPGEAGLNTVVLDSTGDYRGLLGNLALSRSLYSGQMCTTPQNLLVPSTGMATDQGAKTPDEFAADLGAAIDRLPGDPVRHVRSASSGRS